MKSKHRLRFWHTRAVAPARERGLKYEALKEIFRTYGRSREGAWIEIELGDYMENYNRCRSREGAWIEISRNLT